MIAANPCTAAMVLAAGLGVRMRPLTLDRPKPLLTVGGRTLLDHALDRLESVGVTRAVVNTHYRAEMVERHLATRTAPACVLAPEDALLETGGAVVRNLHRFDGKPFYVVNADILWLDGPEQSALSRLAAAWDPTQMDALLLIVPCADAVGYDGAGDFHLQPDGRLVWRTPGVAAPFVYAGVNIAAPNLYEQAPTGRFSNTVVWHTASERGRLFGLVHDGRWFHVGTPDALAATDHWFRAEFPIP